MENNNFLDLLTSQFGGQAADMISQQLGIDKSTTQLALSQFLPIFTTALANNAAKEERGCSSIQCR